MKPTRLLLLSAALTWCSTQSIQAQSEIYPHHFNLSEVTLLDSPFKTAMDLNIRQLMQYDTDRLLTPFVRQAGLNSGAYANWQTLHPNFTNWGGSNFDLSGHVGGHYLSALALAYAACHDAATKAQLKTRLDYMIGVLKDCQDAYDTNTQGLYGFIGGQPINEVWTKLYAGDLSGFNNVRGWVPFYCQHKILAGLRDAYLYAGSTVAKELFRKLADWSVNVVARLSDTDMQNMLNTEHGGMNESMADAYSIFGDQKYLDASRKYSHQTMVSNMQTVNTTFLDNKHANTQVPKYIGFERVAEDDATANAYNVAANNFWTDVAEHRTTCIGGNSVGEHFLSIGNSNRYIDNLDGPESCNSNNMLKLSEMLSDKTHDARYADFYEYTMFNHILSTQDPKTGGYVYFTTLRPQGYRIYSQVNQGMWCCVGTGMENHSKYGHFIYTHDGDKTVYVNLFTASKLDNANFSLTQETGYPYEQQTKITVGKSGSYTIAIRHPWWTTADYAISINGTRQTISVTPGKASYVSLNHEWSAGDVITVNLPMTLRTVDCPNYTDYIAFEYGPVLLSAQTTAVDAADADTTGLNVEALQNEYAGEGRMDHAPGAVGLGKSLTTAPLLIGQRADVLSRVKAKDLGRLRFTIDASRTDAPDYAWSTLTLRPFYEIQHARYMAYWYQQTPENYANSDMAVVELANKKLAERTIDFVATGEQQSEAGHEYSYSLDSSTGSYNDETYRDAKANGYVQFSLFNPKGVKDSLSVLFRFTTADTGRMATLTVDGVKLADITIPSSMKGAVNGFYNIEYPLPASLMTDANGNAKEKFVVRLTASATTPLPGIYYLRLMSGYTDNKYQFVADNWVTGDAARVTAANIKYDATTNAITVTQGGSNNVCLMLDYNNLDYYITPAQKYLMVMGRNLSLSAGASYLWWLNGSNKGTQVVPTVAKNVTVDGTDYQVIAWDMTKSGIAENFSTTANTNICTGQTIFGLTSTTGTTYISTINFVADVDATLTGIATLSQPAVDDDGYYSIQGIKVGSPRHGVYVRKGRKVLL
ncbi:MAG: glycoside hydrolase family 127 protein [Prevotella sp.]|nr:glycoside hydrolase family 127 protein [Prevotella sp.]